MQHAAGENAFQYRLYIQASRAEVWKAIVTPSIASQYYLAPLYLLEEKAGGRVVYGNPPVITGRLLKVIEEEQLIHTFSFVGNDGTTGAVTQVEYQLESLNGRLTLLSLYHTGFCRDDASIFADISSGWVSILSNLKTLLETGHPIQWS